MTRKPFLESLSYGCFVFDGAMGTMLYDKGVNINQSFDELCLIQPALVSQVHHAYLDIGVDAIQTNTFGANAIVLKKFGLENCVAEICQAATSLAKQAAGDRAYVIGAIGPSRLLAKDLLHAPTRKVVFDAFRQTAVSLVQAGVDALLFETFRYIGELELAVEAAYGLKTPIIALATFDDDLRTQDGATPIEVAKRLIDIQVDAIGANCFLGPERIQAIAEQMIGAGKPMVVQPNSGYQRIVEGRVIYQASPETFGVCARRAFKLGVSGYGGCCGTTPEYIRRAIGAARMLGRKRPDLDIAQPHVDLLPKAGPEELGSRSKLAHQLLTGKPIVSIELSPPTGVDMSKSIELFKLLEDANISFVNVPDGPRATARMSNMAFCKLVLEHSSLEPILHVCARDHNLLALQGTLLGAHALGIRNTVMITGDPPKVGDYPDASAVFDVDSIGLLSMANRLNHGVDPGGKPIRGRTNSILMTGAEPHAANLDKEIARLAEKIHAGAEAIMTQPVYDSAIFEKFLRAVETFRIPILMGLLPLASAKNAWFLHRNVPGMQIPELILKRMSDAQTAEEAQEVGIDISVQALNQLRSSIQGVYLMPPLGRVSACIEVVRRAGL